MATSVSNVEGFDPREWDIRREGIDKAVQLGNLEDWKTAIAELESKELS